MARAYGFEPGERYMLDGVGYAHCERVEWRGGGGAQSVHALVSKARVVSN
jgi:hypothetical protein